MMVPASVFLILVSGAAPTLPAVEPHSLLAPPNPHRVRILITKGAISVRPLRGEGEKQVTALKGWDVAEADLSGQLIVSLHAALQLAPAEGDLPERFFSTAVNGWAELWFDRATPFNLAMKVLYTVGQVGLSQVAIGVSTPNGERTVNLLLPQKFEELDMLSFAVERDQLRIALGSVELPKAKPTVAAVKSAVASFEKRQARGRPPMRPVLGAWQCVDAEWKTIADERCWHGRVILAVADPVSWGLVVPMLSAAHALVPDVVFAML